MFQFMKKQKYLAYLTQVIENIEENLKFQADLMDAKNSYLITDINLKNALRDCKTIAKGWEAADNLLRIKGASVMNMKLMTAIDYASEVQLKNIELVEHMILLQSNNDLIQRIESVGKSLAGTDNSDEIAAIERDYGIMLKGFSKQEYYLKASHEIFSDINRHPKF